MKPLPNISAPPPFPCLIPALRALIILVSIAIAASCKKSPTTTNNSLGPDNTFFVRGLDLSFTPEISTYNITYYDDSTAKPILALIKDKGINTVRVKMWNNPSTTHSSPNEVLQFANQIKQQGLEFWLDFHYSDTWADPGSQTKPSAWRSLSFQQLRESVYVFTKNTVSTLIQNNATPDIIQVGNEINNGFLWDDGKIYSSAGENWTNFTTLLNNGIRAIREVSPATRIIIHFAGHRGASYFFERLSTFQTDYDIIGLSYYPWWHGKNLDSLQLSMADLSNRFQKPILIAETAYPWTLQWNDWTNNIIGLSSQLISEYSATPSGQAAFVSRVVTVTKSVSNKSFSGVCYWAADWVAFRGNTATNGSSWENLALFDFQNKALLALDSLGRK